MARDRPCVLNGAGVCSDGSGLSKRVARAFEKSRQGESHRRLVVNEKNMSHWKVRETKENSPLSISRQGQKTLSRLILQRFEGFPRQNHQTRAEAIFQEQGTLFPTFSRCYLGGSQWK